jgi:glycosyltransferase involved in cell wall biosynthesis
VIPNAVDVERFTGAAAFDWSGWGWPADAVVTLFVGRMHRQKGIDLLMEQIDRLAPPGSGRRLLLVGEGPLENSVDRWVAHVGQDRVRRMPWQPDVAPFLRSSRLLVLPSRYEGMPNVVLEAMAAGRPVVCSRVEGIEELLASPDRRSDVADAIDLAERQTFPAGDGRRMAQLVGQFLESESLSRRVGEANQLHVRRHFCPTTMVDAYRNLYRSLIVKSGKRRETG